VGEAEDPVERELEQLGEAHARPARGALRPVVSDLHLAEAHPVAKPGEVPGALRQREHRLERRAIDQREVSRAEWRGDAREPMVEEVEAPEGGPASERLGASALGGEDDLRAIPPGVEQGGNELGWVLEIRVHEDDHVAAGWAEAGLDGSLQAEVPREADDAQL